MTIDFKRKYAHEGVEHCLLRLHGLALLTASDLREPRFGRLSRAWHTLPLARTRLLVDSLPSHVTTVFSTTNGPRAACGRCGPPRASTQYRSGSRTIWQRAGRQRDVRIARARDEDNTNMQR